MTAYFSQHFSGLYKNLKYLCVKVFYWNMEKIDNLDKKILQIVMRNARIPSKDVAVVCGVSRAAIHQRIQRMIDLKVITGSGYHVNPKVLGYATCTYIGVKLEKGSMYKDVVPELQKIFLAADLSREQFFIVILGALAPTAVIQVYKLFV